MNSDTLERNSPVRVNQTISSCWPHHPATLYLPPRTITPSAPPAKMTTARLNPYSSGGRYRVVGIDTSILPEESVRYQSGIEQTPIPNYY